MFLFDVVFICYFILVDYSVRLKVFNQFYDWYSYNMYFCFLQLLGLLQYIGVLLYVNLLFLLIGLVYVGNEIKQYQFFRNEDLCLQCYVNNIMLY